MCSPPRAKSAGFPGALVFINETGTEYKLIKQNKKPCLVVTTMMPISDLNTQRPMHSFSLSHTHSHSQLSFNCLMRDIMWFREMNAVEENETVPHPPCTTPRTLIYDLASNLCLEPTGKRNAIKGHEALLKKLQRGITNEMK